MTEQLLPYYERELAFLRSFGPRFADAFPGVAGALKPDGELPGDPHSERFVEAFAHLNGRIRQKIDDEFLEAVHVLWDVIYPHYLVPVPSMAIVKVRPVTGSSSAPGPQILPRGLEIETDPIDGEPCRFRTCYPVTSLPVTVESASISSRAYEAPSSRFSLAAKSVVTIRLKSHFEGKLRRVATSVQMDRRLISGKIVNAMRDDFAIRSALGKS